LSDRVLDPKGSRSPAEQRHAARALAAMLGRRVHRHQLDHAKTWMRRLARRNAGNR